MKTSPVEKKKNQKIQKELKNAYKEKYKLFNQKNCFKLDFPSLLRLLTQRAKMVFMNRKKSSESDFKQLFKQFEEASKDLVAILSFPYLCLSASLSRILAAAG